MSELQLVKMPGGTLRPANQADADAVGKIRNGALVYADVRQPRNPAFHRRFFALLNLAFEYWQPACEEIKGMVPQRNFERFRKDVLITAGFRTLVVNIKGEARWEAESISFARMDETRFQEVYKLAFNACWELVLSKVQGMTPEAAENAVNQMLSFD